MMRLFFFLITTPIMACSGKLYDMCHVNGDLSYLNSYSLCAMSSPDDISMPCIKDDYAVPDISDKNYLHTGKNLDICPPNVAY